MCLFLSCAHGPVPRGRAFFFSSPVPRRPVIYYDFPCALFLIYLLTVAFHHPRFPWIFKPKTHCRRASLSLSFSLFLSLSFCPGFPLIFFFLLLFSPFFFFLSFFLPLPPPNASRVCFLFSTLSAVYTQLSEKLFAATLGKPEKLLPTVESVDFPPKASFLFTFGFRFSRKEILLGCSNRVYHFPLVLNFSRIRISSPVISFSQRKKLS